MWGYNITIHSNVCNVIEMHSLLLWILCTSFWFLVTTINISLKVLVCCTWLICLRIEWPQIFFHLNDGRFLCCACAFKGWSSEFFTALIDTNITITCILFLLKYNRSMFFALNIICTRSLFIVIHTRSCFVVASNSSYFIVLLARTICVDVSNCFVDAWFRRVVTH